eukprot:2721858-Amphidinium_carterae.1
MCDSLVRKQHSNAVGVVQISAGSEESLIVLRTQDWAEFSHPGVVVWRTGSSKRMPFWGALAT